MLCIFISEKKVGSKERTYLHIYTRIHKHVFLSSINSFQRIDAESRLKYNRFSSACVQVLGCYCVWRHLAAPPAHQWWCGHCWRRISLKKPSGTGESQGCNTRLKIVQSPCLVTLDVNHSINKTSIGQPKWPNLPEKQTLFQGQFVRFSQYFKLKCSSNELTSAST